MSTSSLHVVASGNYFGGIKNVCSIDPEDVPAHDPDFDPIDSAAAREMYAVLAADLQERRDYDAVVRELTYDAMVDEALLEATS